MTNISYLHRLCLIYLLTFASGIIIFPSPNGEFPAPSTNTGKSKNLNKNHHEHHWGPFFEEQLNSTANGYNTVSTAYLHTEAALNCRVGMLKDKMVMWVRRTAEKVSLLTVGNVTYSGDPRIRVRFHYPNNWRLLINPVHWTDAGVYMCQVSTHPPLVFTTNLTILEPPVRLTDEQEREVGDRYYKIGSTIDLNCKISKSYILKERTNIIESLLSAKQQTNSHKIHGDHDLSRSTKTLNDQTPNQAQTPDKQLSSLVLWTKDDKPLPPEALRRSSATDNWLNSRISIPDAKLSHSGNYSCSIGKLFAAVIQVQVLTGELPAAVQHNSAPVSKYRGIHVNAAMILVMCILLPKSNDRLALSC